MCMFAAQSCRAAAAASKCHAPLPIHTHPHNSWPLVCQRLWWWRGWWWWGSGSRWWWWWWNIQDEIDRIEPLSQKQTTKVYSSDKMWQNSFPPQKLNVVDAFKNFEGSEEEKNAMLGYIIRAKMTDKAFPPTVCFISPTDCFISPTQFLTSPTHFVSLCQT